MEGRDSRPQSPPDSRRRRALAYPLYAMAALVLLLVALPDLGAAPLEQPGLFLFLNAAFITSASVWIAALALRGYLRSGLAEMLLAGSGLLAHGASAFLAGLILSAGRNPYDAVAVYNLGAVCAACFHLAAGLRVGRSAPSRSAPSVAMALCAYGGVLVLVGLFTVATRFEIIPIGFLMPAGTTPARQPVLTAAVAMLAAAAALLVTEARKRSSLALRCYGLGLALIALGLSCASAITAGGLLGWTGRSAQYLGYLYLLAAFLALVRDARRKRLDLREAVAEFFRQSESHYRTLVEALRSAVISVDREGRVFMWNPTAESFFGYTMTEIAGRPLPELIAAGEKEAAALREVLDRKPLATREIQLRRSNGSVFPASVSALAPNRPADGATSLIIRDDTEHRQIEELIQSEARFPEENPNPVLRAARDGELLYANRSAEGLLTQWQSAVGGRVPEAVLQVVAAVLNGAESREMEVRCGETDLSLLFVPIVADDYVNIYGLDITARKQAAEAQRRYELLSSNSRDIILYMRLGDGRLLEANAAAERAYGYSRRELAALKVQDLRAHDTRGLIHEQMAVADAQGILFETVHRRKDGTTFPVEVSSQGATIGGVRTLISVVRDVTDRKKAERALQAGEEALRRVNEKLEEQVRERTAELAETVTSLEQEIEQRHRAEQELMLANEKLRSRAAQLRALAGELTLAEQRERRRMALILHDHLQQQLVGALLRIPELVCAGPGPALQAAREIEGLLRQAIAVSRSLSAELCPPILHEAGLKAGLEWLGRWMADTHGFQVELAVDEDVPAPAEDVKVLLFESIRELLFNAVKHAGVRSAAVKLRPLESQALQITVSDRGRGFDPAQMKAAGTSGAGFGLFSIRERIGLIGGRLEVDSAAGRGSRFILTAPAAGAGSVAAADVRPPQAADPATSITPSGPAPRIRVLVADDHLALRQGLVRMLSQEPDLEVVGEAPDGRAAVDLTGKLQPDVVLMDMSMPRLDGIEATRAIHNAFGQVRIIGLSLFDPAERAQAAKDAGAVGYLSKDAAAADLVAAIRACMHGAGEGRAAAPAAR